MSCFVLLVMLDAGSLEERETSRSPWTCYSIICKRNYTSRQEKLPPNVSFVQDVLFLPKATAKFGAITLASVDHRLH